MQKPSDTVFNGDRPIIIVNDTGAALDAGASAEAIWAKPTELHDYWHWSLVRVVI
jgi:hypothetical protein